MGNNSGSSITNCHNEGIVSATASPYHSYVGGIAGYTGSGGSIENCYNIGSVSADGYAGGITSYNYAGSIINCHNEGSVVGATTGGIAGYNTGGDVGNTNGRITYCYNIGSVSGTCTGGIAGGNATNNNANDIIAYCYNAGAVSATEFNSHVGGIAGSNNATNDTGIANCYNTGAVLANFSQCNAGGIAGTNTSGHIYVGIINCYNIGIVSVHEQTYNVGGIAGNNYSYSNENDGIENCYYYDAPNLKVTDGIALPLEELKKQDSYVGFDFESVWKFDSTGDYPFPVLQGFIKHIEKENTTEFEGGTGGMTNPYQVSTPEQLNNVRNYLGAYFIQTADIDMTAATDEGGAFYNDGSGWIPIGTDEETAFGGNYNGNGHRVIGLKSKQSGSGKELAGLFGVNSGVICNLGMENSVVSAVSTSTADCSSNAGGIVGLNYGSIENCFNTGMLSAALHSPSSPDVGGIVGYNSNNVKNCYNMGTVSATMTSSSYVELFVAGGIGAWNDGSIENCYNIGIVSATHYAGGIIGVSHNGNVVNCYYHDAINLTGDKGTVLSSEELKRQDSYVGFDFDTVWSISPDKNGGYPILQGLPAPEDIPTVPEEPNETNASVSLSEKSYNEATGTYHLTVIVNNQGKEPLTGTLLVAAYAGGRFIGAREYSVAELAPGQTQTVPAEITTNKKAAQLKVFFWDMTTLKPLSNAAGAEG